MAGWSDTNTISVRRKKVYLKDEVNLMDWDKDDYKQVRLVGPINSYAVSWQNYVIKEGEKPVRLPKYTSDYDPKTASYTKEKCPYRKDGMLFTQRFLTNVIDRELQQNTPKKAKPPERSERVAQNILGEKLYLKNKESKTFTYYRVADLPATAKDRIVALTKLWHKRRTAKAGGKKIKYVELSDPVYGCDLLIKFDPELKGNTWDIQLAERSKITEEELKMPMQDIWHLESIKPEPVEEAKEEWQRLKNKWVYIKDGKIIKALKSKKDEDDDEEEDLEEDKPKKKKKLKAKSKDDSPPWDDDEKPKKKKKKKLAVKPEKSAKSSKNTVKAKTKKKKLKSEDFDDDFELDD